MSLYPIAGNFGRTPKLEQLEQENLHLREILAFYEVNYFWQPNGCPGDGAEEGYLLQYPDLASERDHPEA